MKNMNASVYTLDGKYISTIYHVDSITFDVERCDFVICSYGYVSYLKPCKHYLVLKLNQKGDENGKEKTHD